jgi:hypothetical protein
MDDEQCENRVSSFFTSLFWELSDQNFTSPSQLAEFLGYGDAGKFSHWTAFLILWYYKPAGLKSEHLLFQKFMPLKSPILHESIQPQMPLLSGETSPSVPRIDRSGQFHPHIGHYTLI